MKATGIVRTIDPVGRVTLPKELRSMLGISEGDHVEIFTDTDAIIIKRFDCYGDMDQLIDGFKASLYAKESMVPHEQLIALLDKVEDMRDIILSRKY